MNKAIGTTAAALLVAGSLLVPETATAAESANCVLGVGAVGTAGGDHRAQTVIATAPPTATSYLLAQNVYADGLAKVSSSMGVLDDGYGGVSVHGYVILGDALHMTGYHAANGQIDSTGSTTRRIGGGWGASSHSRKPSTRARPRPASRAGTRTDSATTAPCSAGPSTPRASGETGCPCRGSPQRSRWR